MKEIVLVTGAAGFIGYYVSQGLLKDDYKVIGVDNLNDYYDVNLKYARLNLLKENVEFSFYQIDISDKEELDKLFNTYKFNYVIHLAAQAGVRYSIDNPDTYIQSNIIGTYNILEMCRHHPVRHLIYASSSSVYGSNSKIPFEETDFVDNPVSLYAATKKSNELMAYTYSHLYRIPSTGLRFFTVYGPLGRPDMAYYTFVSKFFNNDYIKIYNNGDYENDLYRDFTYIDDVVEGVIRVLKIPPSFSDNYNRVLNIGNCNPVNLMDFIKTIEDILSTALNKDVVFKKIFEPIKMGDVKITYASVKQLETLINFKPKTSLTIGIKCFVDWYISYYKIENYID
jgi:UDP-glucuronate 4-epimerase